MKMKFLQLKKHSFSTYFCFSLIRIRNIS
jgi:hypothetical protein